MLFNIMKIIIRLIGYSENINEGKYFYEFEMITNIFNFDIFKLKINEYTNSITDEELLFCSLTSNSFNLKKESIIDDSNEIYRSFVFTSSLQLKIKLVQLFKSVGYPALISNTTTVESENNDDIDDTAEDNMDLDDISDSDNNNVININTSNFKSYFIDSDPESDKDDTDNPNNYEPEEEININDINTTFEYLNDPDFIFLLKIYKTKPELFGLLQKFTSSTKIIKITNNDTVDYSSNFINIKKLNLNVYDEQIITALKTTSNHLSLAVRYLICSDI